MERKYNITIDKEPPKTIPSCKLWLERDAASDDILLMSQVGVTSKIELRISPQGWFYKTIDAGIPNSWGNFRFHNEVIDQIRRSK